MIVIKLGGCNGSGKSSVARALMEKYKMQPCEHRNGRPLVYRGAGPQGACVYVLGRYETACGGMDTISDKDERLALVRKYAEFGTDGIVFFEGLITGKTYGAMGAMSEEPEQVGHWLYAFMDTPFEVCVRRVMSRRTQRAIAKGMEAIDAVKYGAELDAERTMRPTFKSVHATAARAEAEGHAVIWLDHTLPPAKIVVQLMKRAEKML